MRKHTFLTKIVDALVCHTITLSSFLFFLLFCRGELHNKEHIKTALESGNFILAANHVSYFDWLVLWALFRYRFGIRLKFPAKAKLFDHPLWGRLMRHGNCIKVNNNGSKILNAISEEELKNSYMAIFPEGKRSRDGQLLPFKKGVLRFAKQYNKVILPVGLKGFYESWSSDKKFPSIGKLSIHFGKPILPDEITIGRTSLSHLRNAIHILSKGGNDKVLYNSYEQQHAFIDVDNTLTPTNIGSLLFYIKKKKLPKWRYHIWKVFFVLVVTPLLLILDKFSRAHVQQFVYSLYQKYDEQTLAFFAEQYFKERIEGNFLPDTHFIIQQLKMHNSKIVLVSTNLTCFVKTIAEYFEIDFQAIDLERLRDSPYQSQIKYLRNFKRSYMQQHHYDNSIGIGDSKYDQPIFEHVSNSLLRSKKLLKIQDIQNF